MNEWINEWMNEHAIIIVLSTGSNQKNLKWYAVCVK